MIAIISDIHGNYEALKATLVEIDRLSISDIFCLGDIVGYYCQVNECCDELRERGVRCVIGNHDWYMLSDIECRRSYSVRRAIQFQKNIISRMNLQWLSSLQVTIKEDELSMVHGGWENPIDEYIHPTKEYFKNFKSGFYTSGHTHIQCIKQYGTINFCNPGSVGQPRDGDNRAAFATFDGDSFQLHRVDYDIEKICFLMRKAGFNSHYYACLMDASQSLHD